MDADVLRDLRKIRDDLLELDNHILHESIDDIDTALYLAVNELTRAIDKLEAR